MNDMTGAELDDNYYEGGYDMPLNQQIEEYLLIPGSVRLGRVGDLLDSEHDSCVDGRTTEPVVGNAGGDITRLAEVLDGVERVLDRELSYEEIDEGFVWYIDSFGDFYMHSDWHALENLADSLRERGHEVGETQEDIYEFVTNPPEEAQNDLLDSLRNPDFVGCGHWKLMMKDPQRYDMDPRILDRLAVNFFTLMWSSDPRRKQLIFDVLEGSHEEQAVLNVMIEGEIDHDTVVPMVRPTDGNFSTFVNYPQVIDYLDSVVASALVEDNLFGVNDLGIAPDSLYTTFRQIADRGLGNTVQELAGKLPMHTARFDSVGRLISVE